MKKGIRITISVILLAALTAFFTLVSIKAEEEHSLKTCEGLSVSYADALRYITEKDVKDILDANYGPYIGARLSSLDLQKMEDILNAHSAILKSEAFVTDNGLLNIRLKQREAAVRFQKGEHGFYADENGYIFPLQKNYVSKVPVIDGNIPINCPKGYKGAPSTNKEKEWLLGTIQMLKMMEKSRLWSRNIVQINVNSTGDLVMVPREGCELFIFGSPFEAEEKFDRMEKYYRYILPEKGEGYYKSINLKFDKQIVCKK